MDIMKFIPTELLIVIAATYVVGIFLKQIDNKYFKDKFIPIALMLFAIVFSLVTTGFNATSVLQGILCWGSATGISQVLIQANKQE